MECIFCLNENAYFDGVNYVCPDCGREWPCDEIADDDDDNNKLRCPECGSHLVYPDSSGINDYACDACGCRWDGDDDDYDEDYDDDDEVFIGRDFGHTRGFSESVATTIDKEVKKIIDDCYKRAKDILNSNINILQGCADLLMEKERINREEFEALFAVTKDCI